jgi:hypothetical protein
VKKSNLAIMGQFLGKKFPHRNQLKPSSVISINPRQEQSIQLHTSQAIRHPLTIRLSGYPDTRLLFLKPPFVCKNNPKIAKNNPFFEQSIPTEYPPKAHLTLYIAQKALLVLLVRGVYTRAEN